MKKWLMVAIFLLLSACSSTGDATSGTEESPKMNDQEQEESEAEEKEGEAEEKDKAEKKKKKDDESQEDKEKAPGTEYVLQEDWSFAPAGEGESKVALLTIDDAPDEYALEMAKKLKDKKAPAIFFVNGHFLNTEEEKNTLKKIHDLGFPIGNHTETHTSLQDLTEEEQYEQIVGVSDKIEEIIGKRPDFFRAPFGQNTEYSEQLVKEEGMLLMNWTYGYDWNEEYTDASSLADIMVNTPLLRDGANLLMHDREWTNKALNDIISGLREKGYTLLDPARIKRP
ncbi:polysaccharide deacetylase [Salimicrobium jeotgali]|uniref:Polysaccharide deacetylase n=1 Tax=Salimicrobium jeotgali TaxID=1230341 RepID=K2G9Q2_9BACI|nr:polysaccharide deacetylase family protein [Salimicrobium jeotgali]AKG04688.1 polysaccharide deacetylase [Salimicrobium jeotgali]EKE31813.1 polysaccharide deacetylase [Salimicrobium jeotgali]MBM7696225.1 peptidoglycan/xylan/chitin deacetylase (PgdA/CDA1 family) [Salimicrobium jeotgali]